MARILLFLGIGSSLLLMSSPIFAQEQRDGMQDVIERLIRLEEGQKAINQRIDSLVVRFDQRIDDLRSLLYVILAGMIALVGFVIWDRRTALAPAVSKNKELERREERVEKVLREFAFKNVQMREALEAAGML